MWNLYLEYNGTRYPGVVTRYPLKDIEVKTLFSHHSRFSGAYMVSFEVPMSSVEQAKAKFILTSSLGTTEFTFGPN